RKRGSDEPFEAATAIEQQRTSIKAPDLLRQLRDNDGAYQVEALGMIKETHRFRSQPDYQMHAADLSIFRELKQHILHPRYDILKDFAVDLSPFPRPNVPYPLPPSFTAIDQPYRYDYQQAPNVLFTFDAAGNPTCENNNLAQRR
ncbi:tau 95 subunit of transcription factor TFIIIC, partial [Teratosphaeriaceae sp. CCFEE 6253]